MKNNGLNGLFIEQLEDMFSAGNQFIGFLNQAISMTSVNELKETLSIALKETKSQVKRIEEIFSIFNVQKKGINCEAMQGLVREATELANSEEASAVRDAAIIAAIQKIEHYQIASYGTMRSFAKQLDFDRHVVGLIDTSLDEVAAIDKKLTKIAEGTFFTSGINKEAARAGRS